MARIAGVDLPREKRVEIGLTYVYGIGRASSNKILAQAKVNPDTRVRELTDDEVKRISEVIDAGYMVEGDLRREVAMNIKRLQEIGCYRGIRHSKGLPVRVRKSDATEVSVIGKVFQYVDRRQRQTQGQEKDLREPLQTRKNNFCARRFLGGCQKQAVLKQFTMILKKVG